MSEAESILFAALREPQTIELRDEAEAKTYSYRLRNVVRRRREFSGIIVSRTGPRLRISRPAPIRVVG